VGNANYGIALIGYSECCKNWPCSRTNTFDTQYFLEVMRHPPPNYRNIAHPENLKSQAFWTEDPIPIQGTSTHIFDIAIANYLSLQ
jgi:hypothetical protein